MAAKWFNSLDTNSSLEDFAPIFGKLSTPYVSILELVSKELNHLAVILHVYAGGLIFMK